MKKCDVYSHVTLACNNNNCALVLTSFGLQHFAFPPPKLLWVPSEGYLPFSVEAAAVAAAAAAVAAAAAAAGAVVGVAAAVVGTAAGPAGCCTQGNIAGPGA